MKPRFADRIKIVGRKINLDAPTDLAATFARVRREQAAATADAKAVKEEAARVVVGKINKRA